MKRLIPLFAAAISLGSASAAWAGLPVGAHAPDFSSKAAIGGKPFTFSLKKTLAKGPVVLYFFPAAFTQGCSLEARSFAEAIGQYKALGATIVGVSADKLETLEKFSSADCAGKFAVAPDGKILYEYADPSPEQHVANTLKALRDWKAAAGKQS